jgi:hypothetical protein
VASSPALNVHKGWLEHPKRLSLGWVLEQLNNGCVGCRVTHKPSLKNAQVRILDSGVELHFEPTE